MSAKLDYLTVSGVSFHQQHILGLFIHSFRELSSVLLVSSDRGLLLGYSLATRTVILALLIIKNCFV